MTRNLWFQMRVMAGKNIVWGWKMVLLDYFSFFKGRKQDPCTFLRQKARSMHFILRPTLEALKTIFQPYYFLSCHYSHLEPERLIKIDFTSYLVPLHCLCNEEDMPYILICLFTTTPSILISLFSRPTGHYEVIGPFQVARNRRDKINQILASPKHF